MEVIVPFSYRWNRLIISAKSAGEFRALFAESFENLLEFEYDELEVDLVDVLEWDDHSSEDLHRELANAESVGKRILLRLPAIARESFGVSSHSRALCVDFVDRVRGEKSDAAPRVKTGKRSSSRPLDLTRADVAATIKPQSSRRSTADSRPEVQNSEESTRNRIRGQKTDALTGQAWLRCEETGASYEVGEELMIGRSPEVDWSFDEATLSKRHFRVTRRNGRFVVQDLDSTNGTFLNFLRLSGLPVTLVANDVITVSVTEDNPAGSVSFTLLDRNPEA